MTAGSPASASARVSDVCQAPEALTDEPSIRSDSQELLHWPHTLTQLLGSPCARTTGGPKARLKELHHQF